MSLANKNLAADDRSADDSSAGDRPADNRTADNRAFSYGRTIRFHETDAAGVLYFANLLTLCHEAYEAALGAEGFDLQRFFSAVGDVAVPVVHTEADYYQPLVCGDEVVVQLTPVLLSETRFEIRYGLWREDGNAQLGKVRSNKAVAMISDRPVAVALTRHVCINTQTRRQQALPEALKHWIAAQAQSTDSSG